MNDELSRYLLAALSRARLASTKSALVEKRLAAVAIDPLLISLPLDSVRVMRREGHAGTIDYLLRRMTLAQLRKASRAWDKHHKIPREITLYDLRTHVERLVIGRLEPTSSQGTRRARAA